MQLFANTPPAAQTFAMVESKSFALATSVAGLAVCCVLAGCASPGPPLPPTLSLPEIPAASSVSAARIGSAVVVRWTTPERTTDRLLIKGPVQAEVCREVISADAATLAGRTPPARREEVGSRPCSPVVAKAVAQPGEAGETNDTLPPQLVSGPSQLLAYRVQLKNAAGRTAGASVTVYAAAGDAPPPIENLDAHPSKAGAVLEWLPEHSGHDDTVELQRTAMDPIQQKRQPESVSRTLPGSKEPTEVRLRTGNVSGEDPGGTLDRSAEIGHIYRYIVSRVRTVSIGAERLEVHSSPSAPVTVQIADVFPPDTPHGLVAVPGFMGEGSAARPVIDLSWEPNDEPRVAGYRVYRSIVGDGVSERWQLIGNEQPLSTAAYRDAGVLPGQRYAYRITAIGVNGLESGPSDAVAETVAAP
jgi:hypothetical protein